MTPGKGKNKEKESKNEIERWLYTIQGLINYIFRNCSET